MFQSMFPNDLFSELQQLQQQMQRAFDLGTGAGIRGNGMTTYPMLNVGKTPESVELYAFAPGLDPASIDVNLERGVLSIAAERKSALPAPDEKATVHINERFAGRGRVVVELNIGRQRPAGDQAKLIVGEFQFVVHFSFIAKSFRIACKPRRQWERAVPSGQSSSAAICSNVRSLKYRISKTRR